MPLFVHSTGIDYRCTPSAVKKSFLKIQQDSYGKDYVKNKNWSQDCWTRRMTTSSHCQWKNVLILGKRRKQINKNYTMYLHFNYVI